MKRLTIILLTFLLLAAVLPTATARPFLSPFASPLDASDFVTALNVARSAHEKALPVYLDPLLNPWAFIFIRWSR